MSLNQEYLERYSRQIKLNEIGIEGQKKLSNSKVLIIGMGALGSASSIYLTSLGVGTIGLIDGDCVELSNLQRQIVHNELNVGKKKVLSAKETLQKINSNVEFIIYDYFVTDNNILEIIKDYDFIIDATDQVVNKFLINDACVLANKPFSHGGILQFTGQLMTYVPNEGPCYRCMFEDIPNGLPNCRDLGVIGMVCGTIGNLQALECVKYILGIGKLLTGKMLTFDGLSMKFRTINFKKSKLCRVCGENSDIKDLSWYKNSIG